MALFIHTKNKEIRYLVKPEEIMRKSNGIEQVLGAQFVQFRDKRLELDDKKDEAAITALREHRDYGLSIIEMDTKSLEKFEAARLAPTPIKYICPFCKSDKFKDANELGCHRLVCDKKEENPSELQANARRNTVGIASTLNR